MIPVQFEDLDFKPHPIGSGVQAKIFFDNGYGASVVGGAYGLYGDGVNTFEVAVLYGNADEWDLTYNTPITNDVMGNLTKSEIQGTLNKIKDLPNGNTESDNA